MNDPVKPVIDAINNCSEVKQARSKKSLTPSFLNGAAEVFENHGFETTRLFLLDKRERHEMQGPANALLEVLEIMRQCPAIHQRRTIGRQIIKTLNAI